MSPLFLFIIFIHLISFKLTQYFLSCHIRCSNTVPAPTVTFPGQQPPVVYQQPMYPQHQQQAVPHPQAYYNGQTPQMMHNGHPGQYVQHSQPYPTQQYVQHAVPLNQHYPQQKMMHNGHSNQMSNQMYQQPMQGQQLFNQALHY